MTVLALATVRKTSLKMRPIQRKAELRELQRKVAGAFSSGLLISMVFLFLSPIV
jgi:hypothetical protein